ncbi:hypothetical protein J8273_5851 [Carpediemonas membranifera]|uniref:Uncharacterized protein n=1 Tax=Carpediemonas membranifera TaxID=201153 RepID=A0A8J6E0Z4_9EUKA|nr:hypothetical protein J8273_5851 [Carpediemonas membranifera]|eukprot:KAG9392813.1 hypothetical protein J8273_5851 [Carpediemonas membranifera]
MSYGTLTNANLQLLDVSGFVERYRHVKITQKIVFEGSDKERLQVLYFLMYKLESKRAITIFSEHFASPSSHHALTTLRRHVHSYLTELASQAKLGQIKRHEPLAGSDGLILLLRLSTFVLRTVSKARPPKVTLADDTRRRHVIAAHIAQRNKEIVAIISRQAAMEQGKVKVLTAPCPAPPTVPQLPPRVKAFRDVVRAMERVAPPPAPVPVVDVDVPTRLKEVLALVGEQRSRGADFKGIVQAGEKKPPVATIDSKTVAETEATLRSVIKLLRTQKQQPGTMATPELGTPQDRTHPLLPDLLKTITRRMPATPYAAARSSIISAALATPAKVTTTARPIAAKPLNLDSWDQLAPSTVFADQEQSEGSSIEFEDIEDIEQRSEDLTSKPSESDVEEEELLSVAVEPSAPMIDRDASTVQGGSIQLSIPENHSIASISEDSDSEIDDVESPPELEGSETGSELEAMEQHVSVSQVAGPLPNPTVRLGAVDDVDTALFDGSGDDELVDDDDDVTHGTQDDDTDLDDVEVDEDGTGLGDEELANPSEHVLLTPTAPNFFDTIVIGDQLPQPSPGLALLQQIRHDIGLV